jgi:uncharacterized protein (TIGR03000 family)
MEPGQKYAYDIKARWTENGKPIEVTRTVYVKANEQLRVNLGRPEPMGADNVARFQISAPSADAEVWLNGVRTKQTGNFQCYTTPVMEPGQKYAYDIKARWTENGKSVEVTRTVYIKATEQLHVDLSEGPSLAANK